MNPIFAILGLNLFRVTFQGEQYVLIISRKYKVIKHGSEAIKKLSPSVWIRLHCKAGIAQGDYRKVALRTTVSNIIR